MALPIASRLILGAIAGAAGTVAMTAAMNRLHRHLPPRERYPLPPREITRQVTGLSDDRLLKDAATLAHHGYGAAAGAALAIGRPAMTPRFGSLAGVAVWAISYFGWIPALDILKPAHRHPSRRNALMIAAHLVWGAATAAGYRELMEARRTALRAGPNPDAAIPRPRYRTA